MHEYRPIAHATPEDRVAVYIGAAYQMLPLAKAISLQQQLEAAIIEIQSRQENATAGEDNG